MATEDLPPIPTTAEELVVRWAQRDAEYAKSRRFLDPDTAAAVRLSRMREASLLPNVKERARLYVLAQTWWPPVNPDYGSMKDWLS